LYIKPFDGDIRLLRQFLEDYEITTKAAGWNEKTKIHRLMLYTNPMIMRLINIGIANKQCETWEETKKCMQKALGVEDSDQW